MPALLDPIEIDPITLQGDLLRRMRRYLQTALPIHRRFPGLQQSAFDELTKEASLVKGPFLEALPDFPKGKSVQQLVDNGMLHPDFTRIDANVLNRPLHLHQERAMESVIKRGENVVVATGTGSGKTECFLYPLVDQLLKANVRGQKGVRAVLVYPLNALANDQLYRRIVPLIAGDLRASGLTVGRFTGQTDPRKNAEQLETEYLQDPYLKSLFPDGKIAPNWLLSREAMLERAPHILVTNYAMLEHLLLLPHNAKLFENADLKFLVLDEVHSYAGAQATEVALLLRKLQLRFAASRDVRCIGTSASLGKGEEVDRKVVEFATRLFGRRFARVITGEREPHRLLREGSPDKRLGAKDWVALHAILLNIRSLSSDSERREAWNNAVINANIDLLVGEQDNDLRQLLCKELARDSRVREVSAMLAKGGTQPLTQLAHATFPEEAEGSVRVAALTGLVALCAYAREAAQTYPLFPARYHLFARGLEDATVRLVPESVSPEQAVDLRFRREFRCEATNAPRYRLLTCRHCGELYFEGYELAQKLTPTRESRSATRAAFWLKPRDSFVLTDDTKDEEAGDHQINQVFVHPVTGVIKDVLDLFDNEREWVRTARARAQKPDAGTIDENPDAVPRLLSCESCGARTPSEIITPFHPGDQALSAAVCEALYSHLPSSSVPEERNNRPGRGRGLLVFSDNRQDAAFFAPNFQRSHEEIQIRRAIFQLLRKSSRPVSLTELEADLIKLPELKTGLTDENGNPVSVRTLSLLIRKKLFAEFSTPAGSRAGLETLGLVSTKYLASLEAIASRAKLPAAYGANLVRWVLDTIRRNRAISMATGLNANDEFTWNLYAQDDRRYTLEVDSKDARFRLLPRQRDSGQGIHLNRYVDLMRDKLRRGDWDRQLRAVWKELTVEGEEGALLVPEPDGSACHVLDHRCIAVSARGDDEPLFRCEKCSNLSTYNIEGVCLQWRCTGTVAAIPPEEITAFYLSNHYVQLFASDEPLPSVIANEHTAAITNERRQVLEQNFKDKRISLLSSSTTMEMGIDLGDLEGVMLRNVPPAVANYQQRAGRAGRRCQAAPVSITYARNRRYDQDVYGRVDKFLNESPRAPFVHLGNPRLFQRHQFSVLLRTYLADRQLIARSLQIGEFFRLPKFVQGAQGQLEPENGGSPEFTIENAEAFIASVAEWLTTESARNALAETAELLGKTLEFAAPAERASLEAAQRTIEADFAQAIRRLTGVFGDRYRHYTLLAQQRAETNKLQSAATMQKRAYQWANQPIVSFLSKHGIIPTYSFPVDSIELEVQGDRGSKGNQIELVRDARMAIVEYAPGAEVTANGRVWKSRGIATQPREFAPPFYYKICTTCRHIEAWEDRSLIPLSCSSCESPLGGKSRVYIEPKGFLTSVTEANGAEPGASRTTPPPALETQLIGNAPDSEFRGTDLLRVTWARQTASTGRMVVINRGRGSGFVKCQCGYAHPVTNRKRAVEPHENLYTGLTCESVPPSQWQFDLAHTFHTDVLQIRVLQEIPPPANNPNAPQEQENIARTLAESLRISGSSLLQIPESELSITYRWLPGRGIEFVLFDNVPGGAGYTTQLAEIGAKRLFKEAQDRALTCPDGCTTGCSRCMRSAANQMYWEAFRRLDALAWIQRLLNMPATVVQDIPGGSVIGSEALPRLWETASEIYLVRERLGDLTGSMPADEVGRELPLVKVYPGWNQIRQAVSRHKRVHIVLRQVPNFQDLALPRARRLAEALLPEVRSGSINLYSPGPTSAPWPSRPPSSIFVSDTPEQSEQIFDRSPPGGVLHELSSKDLIIAPSDEQSRKALLRGLVKLAPERLLPPEKVQRIHYNSHQPRDLDGNLAFLTATGKKVAGVTIVDRYLLAKQANVESLQLLIPHILNVCPELAKLELIFGPTTYDSERSQWLASFESFSKWLGTQYKMPKERIHYQLRGMGGRQRDYHDRRIIFELQDSAGKKTTVTLELTGGVDILMDTRQETSIYLIQG